MNHSSPLGPVPASPGLPLGLLTDSLSTLTRAQALDTAADLGIETVEIGLGGHHGGWSPAPHADLGIETVEIGLGGHHGGWSPAPHADLLDLLADKGARDLLRRDIASRGLRLEAFNAAGNPLHPVEGEADDRVLRGALQLAQEFEIDTVVTMSGLPAAPGDRFPAWITTVWPPENGRLLEHQWTVAVDYWGEVAQEAADRGVRIAVEMHANQLVFNVPGLLKLRAAVGETVGANLDPSHLFWMGADPLAAIDALSGAIHHVHAKDTRIEARAAVTSRLETIPNERTDERAWNYVAVGTGHDESFWTEFVSALAAAGYDGPLSIENEDYTLGQRESVGQAAQTLRAALSAAALSDGSAGVRAR